MNGPPELGRFHVQGRPGLSYNVGGLETLAYNGQLDRATPIAREGTSDFRPVSSWDFADAVHPPKPSFTLSKRVEETAIVPAAFSVTTAVPLPGAHITSMEEIKALIRRDAHDPRVLVLLNQLKERMHAEGITVQQAFEDFFSANLALNQRLTTKVIYQYIGDKVKMNRFATLAAGFSVNAALASIIMFSDGSEALVALACALVVTAVLCFFAVHAYRIDQWLDLHPVLAGLILMLACGVGVTGIELGMVYNSDLSAWQNVRMVLVGAD